MPAALGCQLLSRTCGHARPLCAFKSELLLTACGQVHAVVCACCMNVIERVGCAYVQEGKDAC